MIREDAGIPTVSLGDEPVVEPSMPEGAVTLVLEHEEDAKDEIELLNKEFSAEMRALDAEAEELSRTGKSTSEIELRMQEKEAAYLEERNELLASGHSDSLETAGDALEHSGEKHGVTTAERAELLTAEAERTVTDLGAKGDVDVSTLEKEADLPSEEIEEVKKEIGLKDRLEEIKESARRALEKFKATIGNMVGNDEVPSGGEKSDAEKKRERLKSREFRAYLTREERENSPEVITEARRRRNQILEARGLLQMPEEDFKEYFASEDFDVRTELNQQNVGDCYAVAAIHAMSGPHTSK